ncbi:MAG: glycoside hydrolase family 13 protein [Oscillospiraceae bacterium]|nr:glycoside hydrolase family 13 protein [Oscillospiraceae bacterium]
MRILFDSQNAEYKTPFGTLTEGQTCHLHIHIPCSVGAVKVECILDLEDGAPGVIAALQKESSQGAYDIWGGSFTLKPGLYFYYFKVCKAEDSFRLFKQGHDTNMESGDRWQLTCTPADFYAPDWARGAVIYQIFPDRFYKSGDCDLTGKLEPYTVHKNWNEEVCWRPDEKGEVLNNDFFGGNFQGIAEKMDYIASFGTTVLYLNPISMAFSNHRYDTGDYKIPDPMLGSLEDFRALCRAAHDRGIRVILDGVFSHTGSRSTYFQSACASKDSPYFSWYQFHHFPDSYNSWWGFDTLPTVNKLDPAFMDYIFGAEDSVIAHWLNWGADGFRLDVADELPNEFIEKLKKRLRQLRPDALLIGEVWEDASNKISYGIRRRYFTEGVLDSCMNYPFRTAILHFLRGWDDGRALRETVMTVAENYPPQVLACNMNLLGSHDTPRILTALVDDFDGSREAAAERTLSPEALKRAKDLLFTAAFLQYTLPGAPSIYYGDEAGMEGHKDPFNRRTYPWGKEDPILLGLYRTLGNLRKNHPVLQLGDIRFFQAGEGKIGFCRSLDGRSAQIYVNQSDTPWRIPDGTVLMSHWLKNQAIAPGGFCIMEE